MVQLKDDWVPLGFSAQKPHQNTVSSFDAQPSARYSLPTSFVTPGSTFQSFYTPPTHVGVTETVTTTVEQQTIVPSKESYRSVLPSDVLPRHQKLLHARLTQFVYATQLEYLLWG